VDDRPYSNKGCVAMRYFRKIVGERLYLSPFDTADTEVYTKWAEWMNDKTVAEHYGGGHHNLVSQESAKKTLEELKGHRFAIILLDGDEFMCFVSKILSAPCSY
jgi:hypothetical protein